MNLHTTSTAGFREVRSCVPPRPLGGKTMSFHHWVFQLVNSAHSLPRLNSLLSFRFLSADLFSLCEGLGQLPLHAFSGSLYVVLSIFGAQGNLMLMCDIM